MIFKELNLISFGKFKNKNLFLKEGLNIIYGKNESGKTTIHSFIDGMFYGFLKPYAKIRNYYEEMEKYKPWNGESYKGIIRFTQNGKAYRIERDFKAREVKVYDDITGNNITKEIHLGERLKDHLPGLYFFNFNNMVYKNTISIKQMENRIDKDLSKEVKDKLANISTSLDQDISVKDALGELDKKLDHIGTKRAYTKPYGRALLQLKQLEKERDKLLEKKAEFKEAVSISLGIKASIKTKKDKIKKLNEKLKYLDQLETKKLYQELLKLQEEIKEIDKEIIQLEKYEGLSFKDYETSMELKKDIGYLEKEIVGLKKSIETTNKKIGEIEFEKDRDIIDGVPVKELYKDVENFEKLEEDKNNILLNRDESILLMLKSQLKNKIDKESTVKKLNILLLALNFASILLLLINKFFLILPLALSCLVLLVRNWLKNNLLKIKELEEEIEAIENKEKKEKEKLKKTKAIQDNILLKYKCKSKLELKRLKEDIDFKYRNIKIKQGKIEEIKEKNLAYKRELELKEKLVKEYKTKFHHLLYKNFSNSLEDFRLGLDKKRKYESLVKERKNKEKIYKKTLGNRSLDRIKEEIEEINANSRKIKGIETMARLELLDELKKLEEKLKNCLDKDARVEERIDNLNEYLRELQFIEEDIDSFQKEISYYENKIKAINLARGTIENISNKLHKEFAPSINREVSEIVGVVTNGKYTGVKVDENLNVSVENPTTKEIHPIDSLSGGTVDQLYFALRFSIVSSINNRPLPLILDDCFIQYDGERLENALKYLSRIAQEKQIILFTCHQRERELLDRLGLKYNLIYL